MPKKCISIWQLVRQHRVASIVSGHVVVMAALAVMLLGNGLGLNIIGASAHASCSSGDTNYTAQWGDTLSTIAQKNGTTYQTLASHNQIANPNLIFQGQQICIPGHASALQVVKQPVVNMNSTQLAPLSAQVLTSIRGTGNSFPFGQCTFWADERYFQLHSIFVPWTTNANAYQWTARALEFNWRVSSTPTVGAILQLDPGVQGASSLGHVAIVESIQQDGRVVASSMNWNGLGSQVSNWTFTPGPGVHFITSH